jgi:predicted ribosomally synthesized peptide with nif11-like leader
MQTQAAQAFSQKVAASSELRAKIRAMKSVDDLMGLANELGLQLTGDDLQSLAQQAYQQWLANLPPQSRPFFERLHNDERLHKQHRACRSSTDVMALAAKYGFELTEADLQQAAQATAAQDGFSFEKLWFQGLGMI